ncbi:MAG: hypothetical protein JWP77_2525 [Polaromonas sp.]|nr:hypothetical protein [Polaromonas sp.]
MPPAAFLLGVTFPGVEPFLIWVMMLTDQNDAIRARIFEERHATQRVESFTGAG